MALDGLLVVKLGSQTTSTPPDCVGVSFSLDVLRCYKQYFVVLQETIISYTFTMMVEQETSRELTQSSDCVLTLKT